MKRNMQQVQVEVVEDVIHITQTDPRGERDDVVIVSAEQVPILIEWLRDAAATVKGEVGNDRSHTE